MKIMREILPVIIFGTAGASKDIFYWIAAINRSRNINSPQYNVLGFIDNEKEIGTMILDNVKVIGGDNDVSAIIRDYDAIGFVVPFGNPKLREKIVEKFIDYENVIFPNIIHPTVIYEEEAGKMGRGNHIGPGAIIASVYDIGNFNYISAGCELGHDIIIGNYNSINPMAAVAGNVTIADFCTIGINATVLQELNIAPNTTLGAGAVLVKDSKGDEVLVGVPAKPVSKGE